MKLTRRTFALLASTLTVAGPIQASSERTGVNFTYDVVTPDFPREALQEWFGEVLARVNATGFEYDYVRYRFKTAQGIEWLDDGDPLYSKGPEMRSGSSKAHLIGVAPGLRVGRHMRSLTGAGEVVSMKRCQELWPTDKEYNDYTRGLRALIRQVRVEFKKGPFPT